MLDVVTIKLIILITGFDTILHWELTIINALLGLSIKIFYAFLTSIKTRSAYCPLIFIFLSRDLNAILLIY